MKKKSEWWLWLLIPVLIACFGMDIWGMYYYMFLANDISLTTGYVDDMTYSEEQKFFMEAQYYPNMFEFKINSYTDVKVPEFNEETNSYPSKYTYSYGVQFNGGYSAAQKANINGWSYAYSYYELTNCTYYNTDNNGTSFTAVNELPYKNQWVYDIGGDLVLIKEKGNVKSGQILWIDKGYTADTSMLLKDLYDAVVSLEDGKRVVTMDLSKYYTFQMYNKETGKFEEDIHETTETWMFVNVYVEKYSTTFVSASQSWFKSFQGDSTWSLYNLENAEYWRARHELNLGIENFTFVYENGGYYLKLQTGVIDYLSKFDNMKYIITIDLDNIYLGSEELNISGFTAKPFGSLGIDTINLQTEETRTFGVYGNYNIVCPGNLTIELLEVA